MKPFVMDTPLKKRITKTIIKQCKKHKVQGATITITGKDETVFSYHYGVIDQAKTPNHKDAMMMIGSTTKLLTGLAILALHDAGDLSLDDEVKHYVSTLQVKDEVKDSPISIKDLLMHASGLASDDMDLITNPDKTLQDTISALNQTVRRMPSKVMYAYSNLSYALLGLIIETVTKSPYVEALKKLVLDPLELDMVIAKDDAVIKKHKKRFSESFDKKGKPAKELLSSAMSASGSATYATSEANAKLMRFFLQENPTAVLKPATHHAMINRVNVVHVEGDEMTSGLAMRHGHHRFHSESCNPIIGHGGATVYHHSTFDVAPKHGFGVSVMTNSKQGAKAVQTLSVTLLTECFRALGYEPQKKPNQGKSVPMQNTQSMAKDYVASDMIVRHYVKKETLYVKLAIFKAVCDMQADGFYALKPRGIARLPLIRKIFKGIRLKQTQKGEDDVLILEQATAYRKMALAFGSPLVKKPIPSSWQEAVGKYVIINDNKALKEAYKSIRLVIKKDVITIMMHVLGSQNNVMLEPLNDHEAITQGFGRNARETVRLKKDSNTVITFQGMHMKKID